MDVGQNDVANASYPLEVNPKASKPSFLNYKREASPSGADVSREAEREKCENTIRKPSVFCSNL